MNRDNTDRKTNARLSRHPKRRLRRREVSLEVSGGEQNYIVTATIRRRLLVVIGILLSCLTLGIVFYREPFRFWHYPLSDLGATQTEDGLPNVPTIIFFDAGMIVSSLMMFAVSARFGVSHVEHRLLKRALTFLTAIGFLVITFPYNISDGIHMTGAGAVFGGLWGLTLLLSLELRTRIGRARFWLVQLVLQGTILPYAVLYMLNKTIKQAFQKPAVLGLMFALTLILSFRKNRQWPKNGPAIQ